MSSFNLDIRTLMFVLMLVSGILSLLMLFIWRRNKTYPGFGWWTMGNIAGTVGFSLLMLRGVAPDFITIVIAHFFTIGCLALCLIGTQRFFGRKPTPGFALAVLSMMGLALSYYAFVTPDVIARVCVVSIVAAIFTGRSAYEFASVKKEERLFVISLASTIFGIFSVFMIGRAFATYSLSHIDNLYSSDWIQSLSFIMFILFLVIWTSNFMMLNSEKMQTDLKRAQVELETLATTDFLTGICNNRSFTEMSINEVSRAMRFHHPLSVIMMDIDHFKLVNDTYGHATGDIVLRKIAEIGKTSLRSIDTIGRLGGEEFGILLPHTDLPGANTIAGYMRGAIEAAEIETPAGIIRVTASFGVAQMNSADLGIESVLERADAGLYEAKHAGRNCVKGDRPAGLRLISKI